MQINLINHLVLLPFVSHLSLSLSQGLWLELGQVLLNELVRLKCRFKNIIKDHESNTQNLYVYKKRYVVLID